MIRRLLVAAALLTGGCDAAPPHGSDAAADGNAAIPVWSAASADPLPARFGVGRPATPQEIEQLDIDVGSDGRGLPPGGGTVQEGASLYAAQCAACHGAEGEGTPLGTRLVADDPHAFVSGEDYDAFFKRTIGNFWPYAPTLFDYIRRAMPLDRPGSLSDDEVYALVAWLLWKNQLVGADARMDAASLPRVQMPARDRFILDDRESSDRVR